MRTTRHLPALLLAAALIPSPALATDAPCYRGVNLSGGEYGERGGIYGTNYNYPSEDTI
ncbi:glycoside hydrolase family 5 protein, partial [Rhizobium ruizarguesonis]